MIQNIIQAPKSVVMIRPHRFYANPETAGDNGFQSNVETNKSQMSLDALAEFDAAVAMLRKHGVQVHVFDDLGERDTPASVFPNNCFSTHAGGQIAVYPMFSQNRRRERRSDVIEMLKENYRVQAVMDYSGLEQDNLSLEGARLSNNSQPSCHYQFQQSKPQAGLFAV